MTLSILIPAYNEEKTIAKVLKAVDTLDLQDVKKEIIVIDDGSSDKTHSIISKFIAKSSDYKIVNHQNNRGKGAAIRSGVAHAKGTYIVIQDADLEYHPEDLKSLLIKIPKGKKVVIYGTRLKRLPNFMRDERTLRFFIHYIGNKGLSLLTSVLYGQWVTDMETGYKMFPRELFLNLSIKAKGFEFEPEITAKILKKGYKIVEVPISTNPRGYQEGKKLNTIRDGFRALWALLWYRFAD